MRAMAYTAIHTKRDGKKYLYSVEGHWDPEKKQARNKQVCLGRIDDKTGEVIPSKRKERAAQRAAKAPDVTARSKVVGPYCVLNKVAEDIGLARVLKGCFTDRYEYIMSLVFFLVQKGLPLSRCESWSMSNMHPYGDAITSQRVSDLLKTISESERQAFFSKWLRVVAEKDWLCYDITSVSSYSQLNEYVKWGYNRNGERLPQINLGMLFGQDSGLPAYYRRLPGSISDVSTLKNTIASLNYAGQKALMFVMDRGFYSEKNVDALFDNRMSFVLSIPHRKWIEELYRTNRETIQSYTNRRQISDSEVLYVNTCLHKWKDRRCYVHIYYNNFTAAADADAFDLSLVCWRDELLSGQENPNNSWAYERFFTISETPVRGRRVKENVDAIRNHRNNLTGFFSIMTTKKMDAIEALNIYRRKEVVENSFDDLKNTLDMNRLRIHSSQTMDARIFLQFLALILLSGVRNVLTRNDSLKYMGIRETMEHMESLVQIRFSGRYGSIVSEFDPVQRAVLAAFGIDGASLLH